MFRNQSGRARLTEMGLGISAQKKVAQEAINPLPVVQQKGVRPSTATHANLVVSDVLNVEYVEAKHKETSVS